MKKVIFLLTGLFIITLAKAQQTDNKPPVKKIEVTGSAEIEIVPDELYLDISLKEYKNKGTKVDIATLEQQLQRAVKAAGFADADLSISNVFGNNYSPWGKKKDPDFLARKQFRLKMSKPNKVNEILGAVDEEGIENVNISSYSHSNMEQFRKEVKIKAMQAAKAKATYMLEAIGERTDGLLEVQEIGTDNFADARAEMSNVAYNSSKMGFVQSITDISFKTIKVRAEVRTVFLIK